ncbi:MAG: DNA repair protein RecN [Candidatus Zixiibacteriota bacterium]|nr:MAG: DNA repair protein RecN [candidate division Zixibacteria bacterium]
MLTQLLIRDFALVEDVELTFDSGMSVLTGETGAGKSVVVTALGLVLGDRAEREHIRHGADKATVKATFDISQLSKQYKHDFADYLKDDGFAVAREISRDGSSKVRVNGVICTVGRLKELTSPLAEILGQHASQLLLDEDNHLLFLDRFASLESSTAEVSKLFAQWQETLSELRKVKNRREQLKQERELLLFQRQEIQDAQIRVGEDDEITQERRILDSSRALMESAATVESILDGEEQSVLDGVRAMRKELDKMAAVDDSLKSQVDGLTELDYQLEDLRRFIEQYGASVPDNPTRLEEINERLDEIYQLKQKYGGSEDAILKTLETIEKKLEDRPDTEVRIRELQGEHDTRRAAYAEKALALTEVRRKAAAYLQKLVIKELSELAIDHGAFELSFVHEDDADGIELDGRTVKPHAHGLETGRFLFSANPGEPLKSLVKTASGGEISRVLLALKAAEKKNNRLSHSLLVFDEVDAGIGGRTATEVGKKIKRLSESSQVLVITHLHQIARFADHHYLAKKTASKGKRITIDVTRLNDDDVVSEIDRMVALPEE